MADSDIYSMLELSTATQAQNDYRTQPRVLYQNDDGGRKASPRPSVVCLVAIALGLLTAILMSLLLYQWILCQGSTCASCPSCPDLWMRHSNHCYYFSMKKMDWNSSLAFCLKEDSDLLIIRDNQEMYLSGVPSNQGGSCNGRDLTLICHDLLKPLTSQEFHWIGLRNNSGWRWEDGSSLNLSRILSNSRIQTCGAINRDGLQASSCEVPLQYICKKVRY